MFPPLISTGRNFSENSLSDMGKARTISRFLLILYIIAVAILCFGRFNGGVDMSSELFGIPKDKIAHFAMFLPYPILMYLAFYRPGSKVRLVLFLTAVIIAGGILAGATELIQGMLQYRSADITDFRADCLGILSGSIITVTAGILRQDKDRR